MKLVFLILSVFLITCCQQDWQNEATGADVMKKEEKNPFEIKNVQYKVFEINDGWGYDIIIDNKIYIHQGNVPAVNGLKTFSSRKDATKVAVFAVKKLIKTRKLPLITYHELDSLNVLNQ